MALFKKIKNLFSKKEDTKTNNGSEIIVHEFEKEPELKDIVEIDLEKQFQPKEEFTQHIEQVEVEDDAQIKLNDNVFIREDNINKYVAGLDKARDGFASKITDLFKRKTKIDDDFFEELENILIMSDIGVEMVLKIVDEIKYEVKNNNVTDESMIKEIIADRMFVIYSNFSHIKTTLNVEDKRLNVILMVGVNGAGKTTTIAKLTAMLKSEGKRVMVAAGDTFRAGAVAQLEEWANRIGVECIKPEKDGQDPASVMFDAVTRAKQANIDVLICDTAGRLQNKVNLMNELEKIRKVIEREIPGAPHETLLVVDATTGQNGISQAKNFTDVTPVSGIVLTKMDGTSKGGIILAIKEHLNIPVKFIGLGEKMDDLQEFDLEKYIYGLLKDWMN